MTIGIAVSTFPTTFGPIMFSERLEDKVGMIAEMGYDSLDLFIRSADEPGLPVLKSFIEDCGLSIAIVAAVSAFVDEGLYLSALDEAVRQKMIHRMKGQIEFAASLNANVPLGVLRGSLGGEAHLKTLARSITELYEFATPMGVDLLLEPVNRYETKMINSVEDALVFIEEYDLPPINLLPDVFHMNIEDRDICSSLVLAGNRIGHLHLADSNRRVPGMGHLPWEDIFQTLAAIGYHGNYSIEAIPGQDARQDAAEGYRFIKRMVENHLI